MAADPVTPPTPPLEKKTASKAKNKIESGGKNRPPRIPIAKNRRQSESAVASTSTQSPAAVELNQRAGSESVADSKKLTPAGCSSPHLALQRKVKAIGNLANRIQRRVVAGVVSQVAVRQRSDANSNKVQPKSW